MWEHRGAFEYEWRTRFHLPLTAVGTTMTYGEAWRLTAILTADPTSQVTAALQGWDGPRSREWFVLADLFDLTHATAAKHPKPYPRPYRDGVQRGRTNRPRAEVVAILNAHGHDFHESEAG